MARKVVGDVAVRVGADVGPLKIGLQDGARQVDRFSKRGAARARALALAVRGIGLAAAAMGAAVAAGAGRAISTLDAIGKKSAQIGITAEALQELRFAAKSAGVDIPKLDSSMERFSKRLGEAEQGFGAAKRALEEMGLEAEVLTNMPLDRALEVVAERMAQIEKPTERAANAAALFGREGVAMVNMLNDGAKGLRQVRQDARDMGAVVRDEVVARAEDAEDRLGRLKDVIVAQLSTALVEAAPLLEGMATGIANVATAASSAITDIKSFVTEVMAAFKKTEEEIIQFEAAMDRRNKNQRNRATKGGKKGGEGEPLTPSDLAGSVLDMITSGSDPSKKDPRTQKRGEKARAEAAAEALAAQAAAQDNASDLFLQHLAKMEEEKRAHLERQAVAQAEADALANEAAEENEETKTDIAKGGMSERERLLKEHLEEMKRAEEQWERTRQAGIENFWTNITSLMGSENEKAFKIGKAFSIAKAIIDGREAAIGSYKVGARIGGPPLGAAFAAASVAATASMIAQIASTKPGGSSSGGGGRGGGGGGNVGGGQIAAAEAQAPTQTKSVTLIGDRFNRAQAISLAEFMNDGTDDGLVIRGRR